MEYRKYAIFLGIVLIVAGTIACGEKDTVSKKDRIKDIEVYDDNNELVTLQETEIVNKASTTIWLLLIGRSEEHTSNHKSFPLFSFDPLLYLEH